MPSWRKHASNAAICAFALSAALVVRTTAEQAPTAQFRASADVVIVDVLVTRDGKPVTGLTAADFAVRDNGTPQPVELAAVSSLPVHLLLAIDASGSVRGQPLDHLKAAAKAAVAALRPTDVAGLLAFSNGVTLVTPWTTDRQRLGQAIDGLTAQGGTALADAAFAALSLKQTPGSRTMVLLFTDGDDSASWLSPADVLETARRSEAIVYTVAIPKAGAGSSPIDSAEQWIREQPTLYREAFLPLLARETGGEALGAANLQNLRDTFVAAIARFNARYLLTFTPVASAPRGWHTLDVAVTLPGFEVAARRGYVK